MLDSDSVGNGFDSATFQILSNGNPFVSESFPDLAAADAFFSHNVLRLPLSAGLNDIQLVLDQMMSGGEGFSFDYRVHGVTSAVPLSPSSTMMLIGLVGLGFVAYRGAKKGSAAIAAT